MKETRQIEENREIKKYVKGVIKDVLTQKNIQNLSSVAKEIDFKNARVLKFTDNKLRLCEELIKNLNKVNKSCQNNKQKKEILSILKNNTLGKYFYISLLKNKLIVGKNVPKYVSKGDLLQEMETLRYSEERASDLLDSIENKQYKEFLDGIFNYIY